jgi:phage tail sheath protein FI
VNQEDNPPDGLALGKARFKFEYANVIPAEHISLDRIIKQEYLSEVFKEADFTRG